MSVFVTLRDKIYEILKSLNLNHVDGFDFSRIVVESARSPIHGDLTTNIAMVLARRMGCDTLVLAGKIAEKLQNDPDIFSVEVAGSGFVNIRLIPTFWTDHLRTIVTLGKNYGRGLIGGGRKVNVEYVSANPTGPMHVGHCRGAVVGDALANLLDFSGFDVTREYYTNDAGEQINVLARSVFWRYCEALGKEIGTIPEGFYPGDYLIPVAEMLVKTRGEALYNLSEPDWMPIVCETAMDAMLALIREDLKSLNIHHDLFFSERSLHQPSRQGSIIDQMLQRMRDGGYVYEGQLPPPKGHLPEDWEARNQILFKSTEVGDDMDRPLVKSDGSYTYFAADVAYVQSKFDRGFERMVYVLGADHGGYVKRLKAAAKAICGEAAKLDVLLCQLVKLYRDGQPVRMSKRAGKFITLRDVVDEVGSDAVRFMMLYRKCEAPLDFDFAKVTEQSKDNPVFYVQYAHARCQSVFRQAATEMPKLLMDADTIANAELDQLQDEGEQALIRKMAEFPRMIEQAAQKDEPHRVAFYLYELASSLHGHWNRGKEIPALRFINTKCEQLTLARLAMLHGVVSILSSGLSIIGANAPDEMR